MLELQLEGFMESELSLGEGVARSVKGELFHVLTFKHSFEFFTRIVNHSNHIIPVYSSRITW